MDALLQQGVHLEQLSNRSQVALLMAAFCAGSRALGSVAWNTASATLRPYCQVRAREWPKTGAMLPPSGAARRGNSRLSSTCIVSMRSALTLHLTRPTGTPLSSVQEPSTAAPKPHVGLPAAMRVLNYGCSLPIIAELVTSGVLEELLQACGREVHQMAVDQVGTCFGGSPAARKFLSGKSTSFTRLSQITWYLPHAGRAPSG